MVCSLREQTDRDRETHVLRIETAVDIDFSSSLLPDWLHILYIRVSICIDM